MQMSHVHFATIQDGPLKGLGQVYISMGNDDKMVKLSLSNATVRGDLSSCEIVENPQDPHCTYYLLKHHIETSFPPGIEGRIWQREAPKGVQNGKHGHRKQTTKADLSKIGVFGENYPTELMPKAGHSCSGVHGARVPPWSPIVGPRTRPRSMLLGTPEC
jgi:hypothetical protein